MFPQYAPNHLLGLAVIVRSIPTIKVQARVHPRKKRRLQKKWLRRYGYKTITDPSVDLNEIIVDEVRSRVYCYPQMERRIREMFHVIR